MNPARDDGIVVGRGQKGDVSMLAGDVPESLRERLGPEGTDGLLAVLAGLFGVLLRAIG